MAKKSKYNLSVDNVLYEKGKVYPDSILDDGKLSPEDFEEVSDSALEEVAAEEVATTEDAQKKPTRKSSKKTPEGSLE